MATKFDDGWYGVFPEGSCYEAYEIYGDEIIDCIAESSAGSHRAGGNHHYIHIHDAIDAMGEDDLGDMLSADEHVAFVRLIDPDREPSSVHVCRVWVGLRQLFVPPSSKMT